MKHTLFTILFFACVPAVALGAYVGPVHSVDQPVKILLVPGHDNESWGAEYGNMKEADMNLSLATDIYNSLGQDKRFEVYITRDSQGYKKEFADYFSEHKNEILSFRKNAKAEMQDDIASGDFIEKANPPHHKVNDDVAVKLYGINKWADENKMDAVIHIHFNDNVRKTKWVIGKYKGFTVYVPDIQFVNSYGSTKLGRSIFTGLKKKYDTSNNMYEIGGFIPDQKLIAVGSNGTLDSGVRSVLVEYGYIYESKFRNSTTRASAYKTMSALTVTGIKNYFFPESSKPL